ncbi:hypothetical protein QBC46DRAFT_393705 [Diplogelasinospora grovesii]|uniref:Uncharacterized protein n=1 Tax=Diplogelasinospora grovesii TaxID=303347 RepID=A0AAN6N0R5_9PEZI|nr:hypothetical protein QBC46DRAFT_393705 [Diplogelasinospora grovesii]
MDPICVAECVVECTLICYSAGKALNGLRDQFTHVPQKVATLVAETKVVGGALAQIQNAILQRDDHPGMWSPSSGLAQKLAIVLEAGAIVFRCLEKDIRRITSGITALDKPLWEDRAHEVWSSDQLNAYLDDLKGCSRRLAHCYRFCKRTMLES